MKLSTSIGIFMGLICCLSMDVSVRSETKKLIYSGMVQGHTYSIYLLDKKLVKEVEVGVATANGQKTTLDV